MPVNAGLHGLSRHVGIRYVMARYGMAVAIVCAWYGMLCGLLGGSDAANRGRISEQHSDSGKHEEAKMFESRVVCCAVNDIQHA